MKASQNNPTLHTTRNVFVLSLPLIILAFTQLPTLSSRLALLSRQIFSFTLGSYPSHPVSTMSYRKELKVAELAVQRAALLTQRVFHEKAKGTLTKDDKSPVTIGDFGAQALIIHAIRHNFPTDAIVGEEDASPLRENRELADQIWELVNSTKLEDEASEEQLGGVIRSESDMLRAIDEGQSPGGGRGRIWALDPVDGTKGFLRGGQYAVCLALIEDGHVKVGALACPNLPVDDSAPLSADVGNESGEGRGVLFSSVLGSGATSRPLGRGAIEKGIPIHMKEVPDIRQATFCESVEAGHSSHGDQAKIASKLGITGESVRMDSQAKYGSIARGAGDLYLRLPVQADYVEKIWDHAAGELIVREAGGQVTDAVGRRLDFSKGRTLTENKGVVAAPKEIHEQVLNAVRSVLGAK
jgi:3'(2'), 5'-bisphosphate nucleotidase